MASELGPGHVPYICLLYTSKRGLGRGLDSLIPADVMLEPEKKNSEKNEKGDGATLVKITMVEPNREQPRKNFDEDSLQELADSIKQFGLLQPILVKRCV